MRRVWSAKRSATLLAVSASLSTPWCAASALPAAKQAVVHEAVKRVVSAAWEIDGYGDLGNKTKIVEAYERLKGAVSDLKGAYEGAR